MASIVKVPHEILAQKSEVVKSVDKKVLKIIREMEKTLTHQDNPKGVGLAAPQIGYPLRIFITKPKAQDPIRVFINPEVTWVSEDLTDEKKSRQNPMEGCLSLPGIWGTVKRHASLKLRYLTPDGQSRNELFDGFLSTIIQHEMDHLEGRLFTYRVLEQKGKLYKVGRNEKGKEVLNEIKISV